jgi:hypothetical protein
MSHRRVGLLAITSLFIAGFSPAAFAGGCGCWWQHAHYVYPAPHVVDPYRAPSALAPAQIYVVRQGPYYSGPGLMVSYQTWSPGGYVAPPPYVGPYRYRYGGVRYGYRHRAIRHHRQYHGPAVYPRRPAVRYTGRYYGPGVPPMSRRGVIRTRYHGPVVPLPPRVRVQSDHRGKSDMRDRRGPPDKKPQTQTR